MITSFFNDEVKALLMLKFRLMMIKKMLFPWYEYNMSKKIPKI